MTKRVNTYRIGNYTVLGIYRNARQQFQNSFNFLGKFQLYSYLTQFLIIQIKDTDLEKEETLFFFTFLTLGYGADRLEIMALGDSCSVLQELINYFISTNSYENSSRKKLGLLLSVCLFLSSLLIKHIHCQNYIRGSPTLNLILFKITIL